MRTGVSVLCGDPGLAGSGRLGLLTNFTGVMPDMRRNVDALLDAGLEVTALFGPEHGLRGIGQAGAAEPDGVDDATGLPVSDTYAKGPEELDELFAKSGVEALVFDMQDIGVRFWTYASTLYDCMRSAARSGLRVIVLDRPNPLGGAVTAGPGLDLRFQSFVGRVDIPIRHGLTIGELALLFNSRLRSQDGKQADLHVVPLEGWTREGAGGPAPGSWVLPSPNMPTTDTVLAFCGTGLFEGTTVSEGRGTTKPFEIVGAPYVDAMLLGALRSQDVAGAMFREAWFMPTFHKYAGETVRGVQVHVHDKAAFDPVECALTMIWAFAELYPDHFAFPADDDPQGGHAIDRLWGSDELRLAVAAGRDVRDLRQDPVPTQDRYPPDLLLYP